jgi:hypothetical protein
VPKIAAKLWNWSAIDCSCFLNTILQNWKKASQCGTSCICACRERSRHIRRFNTLLWMCDMHRKNILLAKTNQHEVYNVGSSMCIPLPKGHARFCWNAMAHPREKMAEPWKATTYYTFFHIANKVAFQFYAAGTSRGVHPPQECIVDTTTFLTCVHGRLDPPICIQSDVCTWIVSKIALLLQFQYCLWVGRCTTICSHKDVQPTETQDKAFPFEITSKSKCINNASRFRISLCWIANGNFTLCHSYLYKSIHTC